MEKRIKITVASFDEPERHPNDDEVKDHVHVRAIADTPVPPDLIQETATTAKAKAKVKPASKPSPRPSATPSSRSTSSAS